MLIFFEKVVNLKPFHVLMASVIISTVFTVPLYATEIDQEEDDSSPLEVSIPVAPVISNEKMAHQPDVKKRAVLKSKKLLGAETSKLDVSSSETVATPSIALPKAKKVELDKPVLPDVEPVSPILSTAVETPSVDRVTSPAEGEESDGMDTEAMGEVQPPLILLGAEVPPATSTRLSWMPSQSFEGIASPSPILVVNGAKPGPTLCLTAAIHGDELNGIEIVRRILYQLDPDKLSGAVIGVPIVNLQGFRRGSRYLTDRRDLNRFFPGNPNGSSAGRIAYSFFNQVITQCDALVDLHTGSFYRENLPQLRADLHNPDIVEFTHNFGSIVVLHSGGAVGTLRRAAVDQGIPAVTLEAGGPMSLEESAVSHGVKAVQSLLNNMEMVKKIRFWGDPEPVYYGSIWVRADQGGILFSEVELGDNVKRGDLLGSVVDPITNVRQDIISDYNGKIVGMAINQVVMPGFAAFHIGIEADDDGEIKDIKDIPAKPVVNKGLEQTAAQPETLNTAVGAKGADEARN